MMIIYFRNGVAVVLEAVVPVYSVRLGNIELAPVPGRWRSPARVSLLPGLGELSGLNKKEGQGEPILTCGPDLSLAVFPPSTRRKHKSDELQRDYNCGLALIRASGVLEQICVNSPHPGGDPACIFEGPPPTVQCLADNPPQP